MTPFARHALSLTAIALASLSLTACGKKEAPPTAGNEVIITIGHAAPLTGPQAHLGKDNENGVRLAIDELNANPPVIGGKPVKFELLSEDDQADPRIATTVAQKFVDEKVHAIIGHLKAVIPYRHSDVVTWSATMHNCIQTYAKDMKAGRMFLVAFVDKDNEKKMIYNLSIEGNKVRELKADHNSEPKAADKQMIYAYLREHKLIVG